MAKPTRTSDWSPDLGLAILAATDCPPHDQRKIAAYMGVSYQRVQQIEERALRKLRNKLFFRDKQLCDDLLAHLRVKGCQKN